MARRPLRGFALAALLTGLLAGESWGKTLFVANNGVDGAGCGASDSPCRSLSQAIENASAKDKISVGPGRYGDLNRDGAFDPAAGEEAAEDGGGCACMIKVDKAVKIESKLGAGATVLDAGGGSERIVRIQASGVTFGSAKKGFTLTGAADFGVVLDSGTAGADVGGNLVTDTNLEAFSISGSGHSVGGNIAHANGGEGFVIAEGAGHELEGNLASGNEDNGYRLAFMSSEASLVGNASTDNAKAGFRITGADHSLNGNVASGNEEHGFRVFDTGHVLEGNAAVSNGRAGIVFEDAATGSAKKSNLYGNDPLDNCGLFNFSNSSVEAMGSFWGAAAGPGDDPADQSCEQPGSTNLWQPHSTKENSIKAKPLF